MNPLIIEEIAIYVLEHVCINDLKQCSIINKQYFELTNSTFVLLKLCERFNFVPASSYSEFIKFLHLSHERSQPTCKYIFGSALYKGQYCGRPTTNNNDYCDLCLNKSVVIFYQKNLCCYPFKSNTNHYCDKCLNTLSIKNNNTQCKLIACYFL